MARARAAGQGTASHPYQTAPGMSLVRRCCPPLPLNLKSRLPRSMREWDRNDDTGAGQENVSVLKFVDTSRSLLIHCSDAIGPGMMRTLM